MATEEEKINQVVESLHTVMGPIDTTLKEQIKKRFCEAPIIAEAAGADGPTSGSPAAEGVKGAAETAGADGPTSGSPAAEGEPALPDANSTETTNPGGGGRRSRRRRQKKSAKKSAKKGGRSRKNGSKNRRKHSRRR